MVVVQRGGGRGGVSWGWLLGTGWAADSIQIEKRYLWVEGMDVCPGAQGLIPLGSGGERRMEGLQLEKLRSESGEYVELLDPGVNGK